MMQSNYYHHYCLSQLLKKGLLVIFISLPILGISATTTIDENNFNVLEQQQSRKLSGVVTDDNGEPLIGATILQKNTSNATISDANGRFTVNVSGDSPVIEVSYVGYLTKTIKIGNRTSLTIKLQEDSKLIDEVVVVGYGKSSVKRLTSSISSVKGDDLVNMPNTNIISSLEGRATGVFIQSAGGEPGALPSISIRGGGEPLYVIDGIPGTKQEVSVLSPSDIESFSILKDAAAAAVYGARAGNGIVMVTTKKGTNEKMTISYNGSYSLSSPTQPIEFLDNYVVAELSDRAAVYNNGMPTFMKVDANGNLYWPEGVLDAVKNGTFNDVTGNTDWNSLLFHKFAPMQSHNISLNGGSKNTHYFMSARYYTLGGIYKTDISKNDRLNMRMHVDHYFDQIGLRLNGDVSFSQNKTQYPPNGLYTIWTHVARLNSLARCFNSAGHPTGGQENPYVEIDPTAGYRKNDTRYTNMSLSMQWDAPKVTGLSFGALVNYNLYDSFNKDWRANEAGVGPVWEWNDEPTNLGKARLDEDMYRSNEVTFEARADYNRTFKEAHTIGATAVFNSWKYNYNELGALRRQYETSVIEQINGGPSSTAENNGTARENGRMGLVGRLKYDYKMRYIVEANFRYDGSDKFPKGQRWGFFPSVSVGWNVDKEPFMQPLLNNNWFSALKFRFSWGKIGLDDVGNFKYLSVYNKGNDFYEGGKWNSTLREGDLVSQDLTWYSRNTINLAVDAEFFQQRLSANFEYFYYRTTNYLANPKDAYTTPLGTAMPMVKTNSAHRRAGYELNLAWRDKIARDFKYNVGLNLSYYNELWERKYDEQESDLKNPLRRLTHQKSYFDLLYVSNGLYQNMEQILDSPRPQASTLLRPGDIAYQDINGDGVIDTNDRIRQGAPRFPHLTYGITLGASYKGFTLDVLLQGTGARNMLLESFNRKFNTNQIGLAGSEKFYYPGNTGEILYPRLTNNAQENGGNNDMASTYWLLDASYLRLKNVKFSYDLKYSLLKNLSFISQFELYVSGNNLLTFSPVKKYHIDPEDGRDDESMGQVGYPVQKIIQFGVNLTF